MNGVFPTKYGDVRYVFHEQDVLLVAPAIAFRGKTFHVEFWMRRDAAGEWVRATTHAAKMTDVETKEEIDTRQWAKPPVGLTAKDIKECIHAIRDGWQDFAKEHPDMSLDVVRVQAERRVRRIQSERTHLEFMIEQKSAEIHRLLKVVESGDWAAYHKGEGE